MVFNMIACVVLMQLIHLELDAIEPQQPKKLHEHFLLGYNAQYVLWYAAA